MRIMALLSTEQYVHNARILLAIYHVQTNNLFRLLLYFKRNVTYLAEYFHSRSGSCKSPFESVSFIGTCNNFSMEIISFERSSLAIIRDLSRQ